MTTTSTNRRIFASVWTGMLSAVAMSTVDGQSVLTGMLTKTVKGVEVNTPVVVPADKVESVKAVFVEGEVALYGRLVDGTFSVIGPDLRARTIGQSAPKAEAVAKPAPKAKPATDAKPAAAAKPAPASVVEGMLSDVKPGNSARSGEYISAKLTRTVDGAPVTMSVLASGEALGKTRHLFVEGPVAFYAQPKDAKTLNVIGPDLRRKTLAAQAAGQAAA